MPTYATPLAKLSCQEILNLPVDAVLSHSPPDRVGSPMNAVVITQGPDSYSSLPGNRYPFKPSYSIHWPNDERTTPDGRVVTGGATRDNRAEARSYAKRKARELGLSVVEVGFL